MMCEQNNEDKESFSGIRPSLPLLPYKKIRGMKQDNIFA
jgi:hypothetical protein